jgi:hypothetical protein
VPPIRPLRRARPDPAGRPYGALAAAPLLVTFRDRLWLARRMAQMLAEALPGRAIHGACLIICVSGGR